MDSFIRQLSCTLASFDLDGFLEKTNNAEAMTWWKTLQINKKAEYYKLAAEAATKAAKDAYAAFLAAYPQET